MGTSCSCVCCVNQELSSGQSTSLAFDQLLDEEKTKDMLHFKLLLLGAGESGKSTVVKQLIFIHKLKLSVDEKKTYTKVLHGNTVQCMITLIKEGQTRGIDLEEADRPFGELVANHDQREFMSEPLVEAVQRLWKTDAIQRTWTKRQEYWHLEASDYYFENCHRFIEADFIPSYATFLRL